MGGCDAARKIIVEGQQTVEVSGSNWQLAISNWQNRIRRESAQMSADCQFCVCLKVRITPSNLKTSHDTGC